MVIINLKVIRNTKKTGPLKTIWANFESKIKFLKIDIYYIFKKHVYLA